MKKKMNIRELRLFVSAAGAYASLSDNIKDDGSVNWDFVSADLHINNSIGDFLDEDIEAVLCAANLGVDPEMIIETVEVTVEKFDEK